MSAVNDYFKDWINYLDTKELFKVMQILDSEYKTKRISPNKGDVFKVFNLCEYRNLRVIILGQEPYAQSDVANGIMFGTNKKIFTPTLKVITESLINPEKVDYDSYFIDTSLESWLKQGVLLLNSSLTVEENKIGTHTMLWRNFISSFISKVSESNPGLVFILLGNQAKTFKPYIHKNCYVLLEQHPLHFVRTNSKMPNTVFKEANRILKSSNNIKINWYEKIDGRE